MQIPQAEKDQALAVVKRVLTEENTDKLKRTLKRGIKSKLPGWLKWVPVGRVLDALLPEVLVEFFEGLLT